jgi:hypothetical protein
MNMHADRWPHGAPSLATAPRLRRGAIRPILLVLLGAAGAFIVLCCGGGMLLLHIGMGEFARQVQVDLNTNPVIQSHIGEVESCKVKYGASLMEEGEDVYVFHVRGTKGSGTVTAECVTIDEDTEQVVSGTLVLSSGETVDLFPDSTDP